MKIVLLKNVPAIGQAGEVHDVTDAHARNFLIPKRLAVAATPQQLASVAARQRQEDRHREALLAERQKLQSTLNDGMVELSRPGVPEQSLYASIRAADIIEALTRQYGPGVAGAEVVPDVIKNPGLHRVTLRWPDQKTVVITVVVTAIDSHQKKR